MSDPRAVHPVDPVDPVDRGDPGEAFWAAPPARGMPRPGRSRDRGRRDPSVFSLDRLRELWWRPGAGLAAVAIVAVLVGGVWYGVSASGSTGTSRPSRAARYRAPDPAPSTTRAGVGTVVVHVAGAVTHAGVVELTAGSRVIDAVEAAGGAVASADLDRLNLAARLTDGQRILVQRVGDPAAPLASPGPDGVPSGPLDLNTATLAQLDTLPGIGPTLAAAILAERQRRGGFRSVNELRDVRGIGEGRFADLRDLVTV